MSESSPKPQSLSSRRAFLKEAAAVVVAAHPLARAALQAHPGQDDALLYAIPLSEPQAKALLRSKMDKAILNDDRAITAFKKLFNAPAYALNSVIVHLAHNQIEHAAEDFRTGNSKARPYEVRTDPLTAGSLIDNYKKRLARAFYDHYVPDYIKWQKLPDDKRPAKKYDEIEKIIGSTISQQLNATDAPDWQHIPTDQRRPLDFEHIFASTHIAPSPFIVTAEDLKAVGVDVESETKKLADGKEKDIVSPWTKRAERTHAPETHPPL